MREAVISGLGFAFISSMAIQKDLALKNLKVVNIRGIEIIRPFYLVTSNIRSKHEPLRHFLEYASKYSKLI
jgi:DNA-binding transcriptional LysR family regulator